VKLEEGVEWIVQTIWTMLGRGVKVEIGDEEGEQMRR
jgi:hypothetical protein